MTEHREMYTTAQLDGTVVTTTVNTKTDYKEDMVYGFGRGTLNKNYCLAPPGILRIVQIILGLVIISLITAVFGPGPFKGILFGQTIILIVTGVAFCVSFIFLIVYFFNLHLSHLDFWPWRVTDFVFSLTVAIMFLIFTFIEAYYSTGAWSNNCNDIGGDGVIHNGCRMIYEWAFAAFFCFIEACLYGLSAFLVRSTHYVE